MLLRIFCFLPSVFDLSRSRQMMRAYCEAAREIGEAPMPVDCRPRHITVILNPAANKR